MSVITRTGTGYSSLSNLTEPIDRALRQGVKAEQAIDFIFPSKDIYEGRRATGSWMNVMMNHPSTAKDNSSSPWSKFSDIQHWGWELQKTPTAAYQDTGGIADLIPNTTGVEYRWDHGDHPTDTRYHRTHALYVNVIYPDAGVIVTPASYSPEYMIASGRSSIGARERWNQDLYRLPKLRRWSDVAYLSWESETNEAQRRRLNKIVQHEITNMVTRNMLAYVLRINFKKDKPIGRAPKWPEKRVITSAMKGFNALLSTPNVRGIVWLLIQHEQQLGKKTIKSLTVYEPQHNEDGYCPSIIVDIVPR